MVTPEEAAEVLAIARSRVYDLLRRGDIPSVKIGRVRRISVERLRAYVAKLDGS